ASDRCPARFLHADAVHHWRRRHDLSTILVQCARPTDAERKGGAGWGQRALGLFPTSRGLQSTGEYVSVQDWLARLSCLSASAASAIARRLISLDAECAKPSCDDRFGSKTDMSGGRDPSGNVRL